MDDTSVANETSRIRCRDCDYETEKFHGWAFCSTCLTPGKPGMQHNFEAVEPTATEDFATFHERRNRERAEQDAAAISWRKVTLPGLPPSDAAGYVARSGEARAYVRPRRDSGYEFGELAGRDLRLRGERTSLHAAKSAAFEVVREIKEKEKQMPVATPEKKAAKTANAAELRTALVAAIKESVPDATSEWNKTKRFETFKIDGKAFALVFAAGARSVSVKIPRQLREIRLPAGANFSKSEYGLRRSLSARGDVKVVAKTVAAAATAAKER